MEVNKRFYNKDGKLHRKDGPAIDWVDGRKEWWIDGELHREGGPAVEYPNGIKQWYKNGKLHREDGPAAEYVDGGKAWWIDGNEYTEEEFNNLTKKEDFILGEDGAKRYYKQGKLHREDGPAVEYPDGRKHWCKNGKLHREDGPAVEYPDGDKYYYLNGKQHREYGPAIEYSNGDKEWYKNGKRHREDGPAIEDGSGYKVWWIDGNEYTEEEFNKIINTNKKKGINMEKQQQLGVNMEDFNNIKDSVISAINDGVKISSSKKANDILIASVRKIFGESYPKFFNSSVGKELEPYLILFGILVLCTLVKNKKLDKVKKVAELALLGQSVMSSDKFLGLLDPIIESLSSLEL